MEALTAYTTNAEIRAALGVSDDELEDSTLSLDLYAAALTTELESININVPDDYAAIALMNPTDRSKVQTRFYDGVRLFSTYAVANQLRTALPLFGPKDITDGKAGLSRFADSPYRVTIKEIKDAYDRARLYVGDAYATLKSTSNSSVSRTLFSVSSASINPVTGS